MSHRELVDDGLSSFGTGEYIQGTQTGGGWNMTRFSLIEDDEIA